MKQKNTAFYIFLVVLIAFIAVIIGIVISSENDAAKVYTYTADVYVNEYGDVTVNEYIVTNMRYLERTVKDGKDHYNNPLFDDVAKGSYQNDKADFELSSASCKLYKGDYLSSETEAIDITSSLASDCKIINDGYFYLDGRDILTLDDTATFYFEFTINGMVTSYKDCAELNYILFEYFGCKVKQLGVTVWLPTSTVDYNDAYCYGHGLEKGTITQVSNREIQYYSKNLSGDEDLEMRIVFPKSLVSSIDIKNYVDVNMLDKILDYEADLTAFDQARIKIATVINIITGVVFAGFIFIIIHVYKKYDKEFIPKFDKEYLRELPYQYTPAEMSYLYYFGKTNDEDVTATLLDLTRRGFIKLDYFGTDTTDEDADFNMELNNDKLSSNGNELLPHEKILIDWFFKHIGDNNKVSTKQIEKYCEKYENATEFQIDAKQFSQAVKTETANRDWFLNMKNGKAKANSWLFIPIVAIFAFLILESMFVINATLNIVLMILLMVGYGIYVGTIKKRTVNGNEEYVKWKAFAHFLEDFSSMEDYPMPGIEVWEEYLAYATSLKMADKVMEQLKVKLPDAESYASGTYTRCYYIYPSRRSFHVTSSINNSMRSARVTAVSTISSHNSGSSGGHGGGFSSGSSHGGGGGGFHGGR